ncbi:MAG: CPBP family intramembrane metalloprotease [Verrucomicrobiales bacterium]|nr:CPBP family intramembrane metalloprotease [Verrucomicrobiales bacterium]
MIHPEKAKQLDRYVETIEFNGLVWGITAMLSAPVLMGGCYLFVRMRQKYGISVREYLALKKLTWKDWLIWPAATIGFVIAMDWVLQLAGAPEMDPWMEKMANNATYFGWMAIAVVITAPLTEEFLFRGFLFRGWQNRIGVPLTILVTSLLWTVIHVQYTIYGLAFIFCIGIFLGIARVVTGNLWVPILIHFVNNTWSTIGMYFFMRETN